MLNDEESPAEVIGIIGDQEHRQQQQVSTSSPTSTLAGVVVDNDSKSPMPHELSVEHVKTTTHTEAASFNHSSLSLVTEYLSSSGEDVASPHEAMDSKYYTKNISKVG
jgi:hypothetical protein